MPIQAASGSVRGSGQLLLRSRLDLELEHEQLCFDAPPVLMGAVQNAPDSGV